MLSSLLGCFFWFNRTMLIRKPRVLKLCIATHLFPENKNGRLMCCFLDTHMQNLLTVLPYFLWCCLGECVKTSRWSFPFSNDLYINTPIPLRIFSDWICYIKMFLEPCDQIIRGAGLVNLRLGKTARIVVFSVSWQLRSFCYESLSILSLRDEKHQFFFLTVSPLYQTSSPTKCIDF